MQFGISPCLPDLSHVEQRERLFDEIIAEAQVAEQVGFDSCLMTEHHPLWVGGMVDEGIKRAARLGDAWFMDILNNTRMLRQRAILYRHTCTQWGKSPYIAALREAWATETSAQALCRAARGWRSSWISLRVSC
jgi:alkanesulfonate monooxygenase SsuD/methylene tetrahydromethanopterin reductase-like flavin-dependent oxidoreductase (luciferase family)